jgi:predicted dithiol-disulfide oxidoreductase (DUF899 family)
MDEVYRLEQEIEALERELATKQLRLIEVRKRGAGATRLCNYVLLGTEGPTYLSELFSLRSDLVLFHVMADCEFCDAWLTSIEHLAQKLHGPMSITPTLAETDGAACGESGSYGLGNSLLFYGDL